MSELRPITFDEMGAYMAVYMRAFRGRGPSTDEVAEGHGRIPLTDTLAAFEDGRLVASSGVYPFQLTVPGGHVPAGGLTRVAVLPTHRRRGLLTAMMRRLLDDHRARGWPVSILYASEGTIYGRFGYGVSTYNARIRIARSRSAFALPASTAGLRLVEPREAAEAMAEIAGAMTDRRPGAVGRGGRWWRGFVERPRSAGSSDLQVVMRAERDGFAMYELAVTDDASDTSRLDVDGVYATTPEAHSALWRYCLDVDLIDEVTCYSRPVDDPLRHLLADPWALDARLDDGMWCRLADVEPALQARSYAGPGSVVLGVTDGFCPDNDGAYEVGEGGASRTAAAPDLVVSAEALGACYLGGNRFATLLAAGRIEELTPGAAERADTLFASPIAPWCPYHF